MTQIIRQLTIKDISKIVTLYASCFKKAWSSDFFSKFLDSSNSISIGCFDTQQQLIGFCLCRWVVDEAEILTIVVGRQWRRQGIGYNLFTRVLKQLKKIGVKKIFLEVHEKNQSALSLYNKLYFQPIGVRENYYLDTEEMPGNAIVLELVLNK